MDLYAVIPTVGERNDTLVPMVNTLLEDGVGVIIVENGSQSVPTCDFVNGGWIVLSHDWCGEPVNLSLLWNLGLDEVRLMADPASDYVVAVFNDDLTLKHGTVQRFADAIRMTDAAVAYASWRAVSDVEVFTDADPWHLGNRMVGYAFALRGSAGLRADEDFLWWWGDSDLDLRARRAGGVVAVKIDGLEHHDPNGYTNRNPALYEQAGRDRETFQRKHGFLPW